MKKSKVNIDKEINNNSKDEYELKNSRAKLNYKEIKTNIIRSILTIIILVITYLILNYKIGFNIIIGDKKIGYSENYIDSRIVEKYLDDLFIDKTKTLASVNKEEIKIEKTIVNYDTDEYIDTFNALDYYDINYKYYEIYFDDVLICSLNSEDEVNDVKSTLSNEYLKVEEKQTNKPNQISNVSKEESIVLLSNLVEQKIEEENYIQIINDVKLKNLPVNGTISSRYGEKSRLRKSIHTGLDLAASSGTPIYAVADGIVTNSSYKGSYGKLIIIDHGNGVETYYAHCSSLNVSVGDKINAGDLIGYVGSTGNSTGPHLHFEIRLNNQHINPQNYIYN